MNAILYYAPSIFQNLGLTGNTTDLLATGVVGIAYVSRPFFPKSPLIGFSPCRMFLATIPAVIYVDQVGRKPVLVSGAFLMGA